MLTRKNVLIYEGLQRHVYIYHASFFIEFMKKILMILTLIVAGITLSSCRKCYVCESNTNFPGTYCDDVYNSSQINALQASCEAQGSVWKEK